ncbi:hypothetical protein L1049_024503 [Liquidambar formosana]|uniref:At1g61320/AtMIF1 LRR domain-containing protein n=1 Tax=Liquidambar formosana TaxID=63359 RepID=A0AAP0RVD1_LIQFO
MGNHESAKLRSSAVWRWLSRFNPTRVIKKQSNDNAVADNGSRSSNTKQEGVENDGQEDRITQLPDSILIHILSFLPTEDAIRTLLIPGFRNLCCFTQSLDLDLGLYCDRSTGRDLNDPAVGARFVNHVRQVQIRHDVPTISKFRLRFPDTVGRDTRCADEIDAWIGFALMKKVNVLVLDFFSTNFPSHPKDFYNLPNYVLSSGSLKELKLVLCGMNSWEEIHLASLKECNGPSELNITAPSIYCPLLENLSLIECHGLYELNICSPSVQILVIVQKPNSRIKITCPCVTSLNISGWIDGVALKKISSLLDATLDLSESSYNGNDEYRKFRMTLQMPHHVKVLTIYDGLILVRLSF